VSTLVIGMDVHQATIAVAYVAQAHGADVPSRGTLGTRQWDIEPRIRTMPSQAQPLLFVYAAGPCGSGLYRSLTKKADAYGGVAPSLMPTQAGERVHTDRRDAVPRARLARSGARPAVYGPKVEDAASRARRRAREDARSARKAPPFRRKAFLLRHDSR
jgi:hypothetical protein